MCSPVGLDCPFRSAARAGLSRLRSAAEHPKGLALTDRARCYPDPGKQAQLLSGWHGTGFAFGLLLFREPLWGGRVGGRPKRERATQCEPLWPDDQGGRGINNVAKPHLTADVSSLPRTGYITRIMRAARPDSGQGAPTVRESAPWPVRIIPPRYVCWPRQSPPLGGWGVGLGHEGRAQRRLDGQDQINKPRNTCVKHVLHKTSAPDGERSRPGVGLALSEAGAALACEPRRRKTIGLEPLRGAHNARAVTADPEPVGVRVWQLRKKSPRGYRRPLQRSLAAPARSQGSTQSCS